MIYKFMVGFGMMETTGHMSIALFAMLDFYDL